MINLEPFCADPYPHPFTQGDYTYATNLHVLVRVPKIESVPVNLEAPVWELAKALAVADTRPYQGNILGMRMEGHLSEKGREWKLGVAWFQEKYLDLLLKLPELEISLAGQLEPMPFRFTGGVGLLMPMKPPMRKAA
jgi:hypothetical protein